MYVSNRSVPLLMIATLSCLAGCKPGAKPAAKSEPPVKIDHVAQEDQVNNIRLTPEAEKRLGIELTPVAKSSIERRRSYGGEVTLPPGASIVVSAPIAGTLRPPQPQATAQPQATVQIGAAVKQQQPVFLLLPLLSPERAVLTPAERINLAATKSTVAQQQIDAEGQLQQARVQVEATMIALERAERLFREGAGTARMVDEAKAAHELAQKTLAAAQQRKTFLDGIKLDADPGEQTSLVMSAPQEGIIRNLLVAPGETVAAGAPLFEVMKDDPVWIKVPVYAGELHEIFNERPAQVTSLASSQTSAARLAKPIAAPPSATALSSTVDLYYELDNAKSPFRPGERVAALLTLRDKTESLVVPWSCVVQDIYGGQWVYEQTAPQTFVRRRIQVRYVVDGTAVLAQGPPEGAKIVTHGAIELFGAEFGFAK